MKDMDNNSIDAIVTDPPYELGFMNRKWDKTGIAYDVGMWKECLHVLKPGGYLLSFGGTRTYHRMACAIEDAGFIIHPMIAWVFGSGFPKATDLGKQFDKQAGVERKVISANPNARPNSQPNYSLDGKNKNFSINVQPITTPTTPEAQQWDGWYYGLQSLKPAIEPICMAQKPIDGKRMTDNVRKWGVGAINVDGCRVGNEKRSNPQAGYIRRGRTDEDVFFGVDRKKPNGKQEVQGRFPANIILDEEAGKLLDEQSGTSKSNQRIGNRSGKKKGIMGEFEGQKNVSMGYSDSGGASRFFKNIQYEELDFVPFIYCAKASKKERNLGLDDADTFTVDDGRQRAIDNPYQRGKTPRKNIHPTVKPLKLMRYLCRLVCPPNGVILDPFVGSGTTIMAALQEGFESIGIEMNEEYFEIAKSRVRFVESVIFVS